MLAIAAVGASGVGRLLGALGGLGGTRPNASLCKGGFCQRQPYWCPGGTLPEVRVSALGGTGAAPSQGRRKPLPPAGSGLVNETQHTSSGNSQKPPEWTWPVLAGEVSQRGSALKATVFWSSDSEHPSQAVNC